MYTHMYVYMYNYHIALTKSILHCPTASHFLVMQVTVYHALYKAVILTWWINCYAFSTVHNFKHNYMYMHNYVCIYMHKFHMNIILVFAIMCNITYFVYIAAVNSFGHSIRETCKSNKNDNCFAMHIIMPVKILC